MTKKVVKAVAKRVTKKKAVAGCETCSNTGLQDSNTLCPSCNGTGTVHN